LIDDVRELKRTFSTSSYEGRGSVALLFEAQRLKAESANALLKLLEEPPEEKFFILTADSLESLLPTIISRCQPILVSAPRQNELEEILRAQHDVEAERAKFVARLAHGNVRYALALLEEDFEGRRKLAVEYLRMAFKFNKPVEQVEFLNRLVQENDRHALQELLQFCASWLRDAYVLKCGGAEQPIVNTDFRAALSELNKNLPQFDFDLVLEEVEYAITCLERYVQPWLVLMVLLQRLRQYSRPEK
jgi:DNA polymerase-3 subunit delta'